jgi:hypothetical protein
VHVGHQLRHMLAELLQRRPPQGVLLHGVARCLLQHTAHAGQHH